MAPRSQNRSDATSSCSALRCPLAHADNAAPPFDTDVIEPRKSCPRADCPSSRRNSSRRAAAADLPWVCPVSKPQQKPRVSTNFAGPTAMVSFGGVNLGRRTFVPDMPSLFAAGSTRGTPRDNCSPQCRCSNQGKFEAFLHGEVDACRAVDTMHLSVGKGAALDSASVTRVSVMATSSQYSTLAPSRNWFQKQTTSG